MAFEHIFTSIEVLRDGSWTMPPSTNCDKSVAGRVGRNMEKVEKGRVGSELRGEGEKRWNERGVRSGGGEGVNQGDLARSLGETEGRLLSKGGQMVIALLPHTTRSLPIL